MNFKMSNWAQVTIAGDTPQLPTSGQGGAWSWKAAKLWCGLVKTGSAGSMCLTSRSHGAAGRPLQLLYHTASSIRALREKCTSSPKWHPVGWVSDVHRCLLSASLSSPGRLEPAAEIRKDQPLPSDDSSTTFVESSRSTRHVRGSWLCRPQQQQRQRNSTRRGCLRKIACCPRYISEMAKVCCVSVHRDRLVTWTSS